MGLTNAERQAGYRARQRLLSRKPWSMNVTEEERFFLERVLLTLRETGATPCVARDPKTGRFVAIDV